MVYTQQSMFGMVRNVQPCPDCNGTGQVIRYKCPDCSGSGYIKVRKKIKVPIPAGIDNGQSVRIREKGEPGINGGPRGDLLVNVNVSRHPKFQRQEYDIFSTEPITFAQAALGATIKIDTVDGPMEYTIKPGTQTDTKIRLKNKGVPSLRNKNLRGNHFVTLVVQVPERIQKRRKRRCVSSRKPWEKCRQRIPRMQARQNRNMRRTKSMRNMKNMSEKGLRRKEKEITGDNTA